MLSPLQAFMTLSPNERAEKGVEYTPNEILSQPSVWIKNFEILKKREDEMKSFVEANILSKKSPRVILSGAGSSEFIGLAVENLLRKKWQVDVETKASTNIVTNWDSIFLRNRDTTLISFSRSGNSPESVGAIVLADKFLGQANHIVITCNRNGKMAEMKRQGKDALLLLLSEGAEDRGLAMTVSFTTMLMAAQFLAFVRKVGEYGRIVESLSRATERVLKEYSSLLRELAELDFERAFFLGTGALYGCAAESSLKLQELTAGRIIGKFDTFLGLRHGPEVAVNDKTLVVFFVSTDPFVRRYELDLMQELHDKGLGLRKIAVCNRSDQEIERFTDHAVEFDPEGQFAIPDLCRPVIDVTVGQVLALFKSLSLGLKPDNPSEKGIITRVVRGVKVYNHESFRDHQRLDIISD